MNLRTVVRALPSIKRRDALIGNLKSERARLRNDVAALRTDLAQAHSDRQTIREKLKAQQASSRAPSWRYKLTESVRVRSQVRELGAVDPIWVVNDKPSGYAFARSHGLEVPAHLAGYDDFEDIAWADLPEAFVIKTANGTSSRGVLPLERRGAQVIDLLDLHQGPIEVADVVGYLNQMHANGHCSRDVVIEELIRSPFDPTSVAPDLKLYCFYGEVGMIMIRDVHGSRKPEHFSTRFLNADGTDLGQAIVGRDVNAALPVPLHLDDVVAAGELLSAAIPVPFIRVDLFERPEGVVFGEVTAKPGGKQDLRSDLDRQFGASWEQAEARLRAEAITTKAIEVRYGDAR